LEPEILNELQSLRSALRNAEAELQRVRDEGETRRDLVDILHEVMGDLPTDEIFHFLARRLARALRLSHASVIRAVPGAPTGVVATAFEQPYLHDLVIALDRYPEVVAALNGQIPVLIPDLESSPLYAALREGWVKDGTTITVRSVMALPFPIDGESKGVFLLRRTSEEPRFDAADVEFASEVVRSGVAAIQRAHPCRCTRHINECLVGVKHNLNAVSRLNPKFAGQASIGRFEG